MNLIRDVWCEESLKWKEAEKGKTETIRLFGTKRYIYVSDAHGIWYTTHASISDSLYTYKICCTRITYHIFYTHLHFLQNGKYSFCQLQFRVALAGFGGTHWYLQLLKCRLQPLGADFTMCHQSNHSSKASTKIKTFSEAHFIYVFHRDAHSYFVLLPPTSSLSGRLMARNGITTNFHHIMMEKSSYNEPLVQSYLDQDGPPCIRRGCL